MQAFYESFIKKFQDNAGERLDIKTAYLIGSQAQKHNKIDDWSDLDILIYTDTPTYYLENTDFIESLGIVWSSLLFSNQMEGNKRTTLYEGGYQVDLIIKNSADYQQHLDTETVPQLLCRGAELLVDNDGNGEVILPKEDTLPPKEAVTESSLRELNQQFWFKTMFISKQLLRKDIWLAKAQEGEYHQLILQIIEWYEATLRGDDYDTWYEGKFLEEWAELNIYEEVKGLFATFDIDSNWEALQNAMNLFTRLARGIATKKGFDLDESLRENVVKWIATKRIGELFGRD